MVCTQSDNTSQCRVAVLQYSEGLEIERTEDEETAMLPGEMMSHP